LGTQFAAFPGKPCGIMDKTRSAAIQRHFSRWPSFCLSRPKWTPYFPSPKSIPSDIRVFPLKKLFISLPCVRECVVRPSYAAVYTNSRSRRSVWGTL